ncbi:MAG: CDP-2,3-bis-(O-geranylgeranyl)-sn-glycerol synthase [Candidatus Altiarchaeales archaeon]|nr:MAG: CDP-2,3-bis-(O-geranylgeranyl)-sn-glycerol synthase [Candidatus Altiarchaeales archaeon]
MIFNLEHRLIDAIWFILPAYFANMTPVHVAKLSFLEPLGKPMDFGKKIFGKRIFGDGKTWRGFFAGIIVGTLVSYIQTISQKEIELILQNLLNDQNFHLPLMNIELAFMLSLGAMVGDIAGSFIKRQSGLKRGDPAPLLDQLDFVFGAVFFSWLLLRKINYERFYVLILVTPVLHVITNFIAWIYKLKRKPW